MAFEYYTLKDDVFETGLAKGASTEDLFDNSRKVIVVGGAAVQLNVLDAGLYRPTTDIDFATNRPTTRSQKRQWAEGLEEKISKDTVYNVRGGLSRYGAEVRFLDESKPDFLLHLDCFGENFFERHREMIEGEFERARYASVKNNLVRYLSPMDVVVSKLKRITRITKSKKVSLSPNQKYALNLILNGNFDNLNTEDLDGELGRAMKVRNQTVEDLGRYGFSAILQEIEGYKMVKDFYDILSVVDSSRKMGENLSKNKFSKALKYALIE